jgi:hypothetical protein
MNRWSPPAMLRIILSLTDSNIVVEPWNPDNTPKPRRIIRCWRLHTRGGTVWFELNCQMNHWVYLSKHQFIRCWSRSLGASLLNLNAIIGWTDGQGVGSSGAEARSLDPYYSQTLRRRMNRCLNRRFIRRSILNLLAAELIRRVLIIGCRFIWCYVLISTHPIQRLWVFRWFFNIAPMNSLS